MSPAFEEYTGPDALAYVVSTNLHRRHLTESQRGMVAAKLATLMRGRPSELNPSIDGFNSLVESRAAKDLNVGISTVQRAKRIQRDGVPELAAAVEKGDLTVGAAYKITTLPKEEQSAIVKAGPEAVKKKAAELRMKPETAARVSP